MRRKKKIRIIQIKSERKLMGRRFFSKIFLNWWNKWNFLFFCLTFWNVPKLPRSSNALFQRLSLNMFLKKIQDFIFYLFLKHKTTMNGIKSPFQMFWIEFKRNFKFVGLNGGEGIWKYEWPRIIGTCWRMFNTLM